jgi:hypothetical protein
MIAMELKCGFCSSTKTTGAPLRSVSAVVFATPCTVCEVISEALFQDKLVISVINQNDVVPLFSRKNIALLSDEMKLFIASGEAEEIYKRDYADIKKYASSMGKANDATSLDATSLDVVVDTAKKPIPIVQGSSSDSKDPNVFVNAVLAKPVDNTVEKKEIKKIEATNDPFFQIRLVPPGIIIHLYRKSNKGEFLASMSNYTLPNLHRLKLLSSGIDDHSISNYANSLRSINYMYKSRNNIKSHIPNHDDNNTITCWDSTQGVNNDEGNKINKFCSICNLDCTWTNITHSEASRANSTHICSFCDRVVCTVCSPAGDKIQGDGINNETTLADRRLTIPSKGNKILVSQLFNFFLNILIIFIGIITPERVCLHCFFNSYHLV